MLNGVLETQLNIFKKISSVVGIQWLTKQLCNNCTILFIKKCKCMLKKPRLVEWQPRESNIIVQNAVNFNSQQCPVMRIKEYSFHLCY